MIERKTLNEFRKTGLLLFVNQFLHIFGWAIVVDTDTDEMYPARVKFRGFDEKNTADAYIKLSEYMKDNSEVLSEEAKE